MENVFPFGEAEQLGRHPHLKSSADNAAEEDVEAAQPKYLVAKLELARPKMRPSGINQFSKADPTPTSLYPSKHYLGKKLVCTMAIESFVPYFQRLNGTAS